jgi:hypothetical protein
LRQTLILVYKASSKHKPERQCTYSPKPRLVCATIVAVEKQ